MVDADNAIVILLFSFLPSINFLLDVGLNFGLAEGSTIAVAVDSCSAANALTIWRRFPQ